MTEQNDIGTAPAAPEDESPFLDENVEEEVAEEGEDGDPDDYYLGRVDKLLRLDQTGELPRLTPQSIFGNATTRERVSPERKERFASRLTFFMKSQSRPLLSSELVDFLFDR